MRIWLNKHFGFNKSEFNGLLLLIVIIVALKSFPVVYHYLGTSKTDSAEMLAKIQKIEITDQQRFNYNSNHKERFAAKTTGALFTFDPNQLNVEGWQSLGLSPKQAQSIVNYTQKGGKFYKAEDLQKMYTISPKMYKRLLPFVKIEGQNNFDRKSDFAFEKKEYVKKAAVIVDINTADSAQLDEIKGVGGAFANRILKYRERLGGFHKKEQLMEVYGLDSTRYEEIKSQVSVSTVALKVINVNSAQFNDLKTNPYLTYKQINAIIQYRKQHGNYNGPADLKKVLILNQQVIDKITPYISF